ASQSVGVYIGKLDPNVSNNLLADLLACCGGLSKLARVPDPATNALKPFGIATFATPRAAAVAVRVLNGMPLAGQEIVVKVGKKDVDAIQPFLDAFDAAPAAVAAAKAAAAAEAAAAEESEAADVMAVSGTTVSADDSGAAA
ncbi:unnamed protein product, partial [Phaeothamnion confervicola]